MGGWQGAAAEEVMGVHTWEPPGNSDYAHQATQIPMVMQIRMVVGALLH